MRPPMRLMPNRPPSAPGAARRLSVGVAGRGGVDAAVDSRLRGNDEERGVGSGGLNGGGKDAVGGYWKEGLRIAGRGAVTAAVDSRFRGNDEKGGCGNAGTMGFGDGGLIGAGPVWRPGG